jgi:hypothetical protein
MVELLRFARRIVLFAGAWTLCVDASCSLNSRDDDDEPIPGASRRLDEACRSGCVVEGSASMVSGLTSDSVALRLGPGPGSVHFSLGSAGSVPHGYSWHVELLVSGTGSFTAAVASCGDDTAVGRDGTTLLVGQQPFSPPADYHWLMVGRSCDSGTASQSISVDVSGNDESVLDIVDVRIVAVPPGSGSGCSTYQ